MKKVLIVEDNMLNREGLARLLQRRGYTTYAAGDGNSALSMFTEFSPDLILMDISLPDIEGYEITRRIRTLELERNLGRVPIIALTAHAMPQDREEAVLSGFTDFETKPVDLKKLLKSGNLQR